MGHKKQKTIWKHQHQQRANYKKHQHKHNSASKTKISKTPPKRGPS